MDARPCRHHLPRHPRPHPSARPPDRRANPRRYRRGADGPARDPGRHCPGGAGRRGDGDRPQVPDFRDGGPLNRLQDRAAKRRQIAKDVMAELDLKKLAAPDFTVSIRPGMPALVVLNEDAVPKTYWEPGEPRLRRQVLANDLKGGAEVAGATLSNPEPVLSVRTR